MTELPPPQATLPDASQEPSLIQQRLADALATETAITASFMTLLGIPEVRHVFSGVDTPRALFTHISRVGRIMHRLFANQGNSIIENDIASAAYAAHEAALRVPDRPDSFPPRLMRPAGALMLHGVIGTHEIFRYRPFPDQERDALANLGGALLDKVFLDAARREARRTTPRLQFADMAALRGCVGEAMEEISYPSPNSDEGVWLEGLLRGKIETGQDGKPTQTLGVLDQLVHNRTYLSLRFVPNRARNQVAALMGQQWNPQTYQLLMQGPWKARGALVPENIVLRPEDIVPDDTLMYARLMEENADPHNEPMATDQ